MTKQELIDLKPGDLISYKDTKYWYSITPFLILKNRGFYKQVYSFINVTIYTANKIRDWSIDLGKAQHIKKLF